MLWWWYGTPLSMNFSTALPYVLQVGCGVDGWHTRLSGDARCEPQSCTHDNILDYGRFLEGFNIKPTDLPAVSSDEPLVIPAGTCLDTYNRGPPTDTAMVVHCRALNATV